MKNEKVLKTLYKLLIYKKKVCGILQIHYTDSL